VEVEGKEEAAAAAAVAKEEALALSVVVDLLRHILSGRLLMTPTVSAYMYLREPTDLTDSPQALRRTQVAERFLAQASSPPTMVATPVELQFLTRRASVLPPAVTFPLPYQ
jgi:hypothetical protein